MRFSLKKKNKAFQKKYMKAGVKKLLRAGMMPARTWRAHAVGMFRTERFKIEKTDGSSSRQKEHNLSVLVHGSFWLGSGRRAFHHGHSVLGRRSLELEKWRRKQKEACG